LLMVVEQDPAVVAKVLESNPGIHEWVKNTWVHFVVIDPRTGELLRRVDEKFIPYVPLTEVQHLDHLQDKLLSTQQNLPVYLIDSL